jgi:hypothetical protein
MRAPNSDQSEFSGEARASAFRFRTEAIIGGFRRRHLPPAAAAGGNVPRSRRDRSDRGLRMRNDVLDIRGRHYPGHRSARESRQEFPLQPKYQSGPCWGNPSAMGRLGKRRWRPRRGE